MGTYCITCGAWLDDYDHRKCHGCDAPLCYDCQNVYDNEIYCFDCYDVAVETEGHIKMIRDPIVEALRNFCDEILDENKWRDNKDIN